MQSVEGQINLRRKQVEEWIQKCESIETECAAYGEALGGYVKATGSSVSGLRKEQVLPKRYERLSEYHEKLRQVSV
jgi:protein regulator of cytokinesis 1